MQDSLNGNPVAAFGTRGEVHITLGKNGINATIHLTPEDARTLAKKMLLLADTQEAMTKRQAATASSPTGRLHVEAPGSGGWSLRGE